MVDGVSNFFVAWDERGTLEVGVTCVYDTPAEWDLPCLCLTSDMAFFVVFHNIFFHFGEGDSVFLSVLSSKYDNCEKDSSELDVPKVYSSENRIFRASSALNVHFF